MRVVRCWSTMVLLATIVACEFPHPARHNGGDGGATDDGRGADSSDASSSDGASQHGLSTFATVNGVALETKRSFFGHAIVRQQLTVVGGTNDTTIGSAEQAPIMTGDAIGNFVTTSTLNAAVCCASLVERGGELLVIGGSDSSLSSTTKVQFATLGGDGTLGNTFGPFSVQLATARSAGGALETNNHTHVIGGNDNRNVSTDLASVEGFAATGTFTTESVALRTARSQFATVVANNRVYVIGGTQDSDKIEVATINADGTLTTFADSGVHLVIPRLSHAAVALNGTLYVIGGRNAQLDPIGSVEAAPIHADGSLGAFAIVAGVTLQTPRYGHGADVIGNSIYVVGGQSDIATFLTSVERAILR